MDSQVDYYEVLGVSKQVTPQELKTAYRKLALRYHPDQHPEDRTAEEMFKTVSEAYAILSDPERRKEYDQSGITALLRQAPDSLWQGLEEVKRFFQSFSEDWKRATQKPIPGLDLRYELRVALQETLYPIEKNIEYMSRLWCTSCDGIGTQDGRSGWRLCMSCQGEGRVERKERDAVVFRDCIPCRATGRTILSPCGHCQGLGTKRTKKSLFVKIPAGVKDGESFRIESQGDPGKYGGPPGDLWVLLCVEPDRYNRREGNNFICEVPVPITQAILGGPINVPTLEKTTIEVIVPERMFVTSLVRIPSGGFPVEHHSKTRGDSYYHLCAELPSNMTVEQIEKMEEWSKSLTGHNYPRHSAFVASLPKEG